MTRALAILLLLPICQDSGLDEALRAVSVREIRADLEWLASPEREGRESGAAGGHAAALYIGRVFEEAGLQPGGLEGTWFQSFDANGQPHERLRREAPENGNFLEVPGRGGAGALRVSGERFHAVPGAPEGDVSGSLVFAGDRRTNVRRMIVAIEAAEGGAEQIRSLAEAGASGVVLITDGEPPEGDFTIPAATIPREAAAEIGDSRGRASDRLAGLRIRDARLAVQGNGPVAVGYKNVIGIWPGSDPELRDQYVVIGAHYDHIGRGNFGSRGTPGQIHCGANDNGSGTSSILSMARAMRHTTFRRTVMLISFDAEERGLWGSLAYVRAPTWPLDRCVGMINMDMLGAGELTAIAIGRTDPDHAGFNNAIAAAQERFRMGFDMTGADDYVRRSDQWSFAEEGVAGIFLFGGMHDEYHTERDTIDVVNLPKVEAVARLALFIAAQLADAD